MEATIRLTSYGNSGAEKRKILRLDSNLQNLRRQRIYTEFVRKTTGKTENEMEK